MSIDAKLNELVTSDKVLNGIIRDIQNPLCILGPGGNHIEKFTPEKGQSLKQWYHRTIARLIHNRAGKKASSTVTSTGLRRPVLQKTAETKSGDVSLHNQRQDAGGGCPAKGASFTPISLSHPFTSGG